MKTKINVEIHKNGSENDVILKAISNHNEGLCNILLNDVAGYIHTRKAMYPTIHKYHTDSGENNLHISEDGGKTLTLSLQWVEVHELNESEAGLLLQENLS